MSSSCIFCKIARKEIDTAVIYEDELTIAFADIAPQAPTHILVIPKKHLEHIKDIKKDLSNALFSAINVVSQNMDGYRLVMNFGKDAGQAVPHLHFHVMSGRKMNWPPG
ncbi:MAG: HIT domain-containing protein [Candidatus Saganbacteria bacterium]|nr:HIT domain-containing protein [Candidatus Saganbacteria bacterium]